MMHLISDIMEEQENDEIEFAFGTNKHNHLHEST